MKSFLTDLWKFYKDVHAGGNDASAKRVYGGVIIVAILVMIYLFGKEIFSQQVWQTMKDTIEYFFLIGAGLIGFGMVETIVKTWKGKGNDPA